MISFQNFSFRYEESQDFTLRGIDMTVQTGEFIPVSYTHLDVYKRQERLRVRDSYTVLGCVRQPLAKLADGPMHLQIVRIDFAEYIHG